MRWSLALLAAVSCAAPRELAKPAPHEPVMSPPAASAAPPVPLREAPTESVDFSEPAEPTELASGLALPQSDPAPAWCRSLVVHPIPRAPSQCETPAAARMQLARALSQTGNDLLRGEQQRASCDHPPRTAPPLPPERPVVMRDRALARLEACAGLAPGFVRALRADLALPCADTLAAAAPPQPQATSAPYRHALFGLAMAAKLLRRQYVAPPFRPAADAAPEAPPFIERQLLPWADARWQALQEPERLIKLLPSTSYGGAIARLAFAETERRLLAARHGVELPAKWKASYELRTSFYQAFDAITQARPKRSPPFVALDAMATAGSVRSRYDLLLSQGLTGRRDLLRQVLLPAPELPALDDDHDILAASLPPFFTSQLLTTAELANPDTLRAALLQGLSPGARGALAQASLGVESRQLLVRAELVLALLTASPERARKAAALARAAERKAPELELLQAIAEAFGSLGQDAELRRGEKSQRGAELGPLLELAKGAGLHAAIAALDAYPLSLLPTPLAPEAFQRAQGYLDRGGQLLPPELAKACLRAAAGSSQFLGERPCVCPLTWGR